MDGPDDPPMFRLSLPAGWTPSQRSRFLDWVRGTREEHLPVEAPRSLPNASVDAVYAITADLLNQGWELACEPTQVIVRPPVVNSDPTAERERVRQQELLKRDEHLRRESVVRFVTRMEAPRLRGNESASILSLMRDGRELALAFRGIAVGAGVDTGALRSVLNPYIQVVAAGERCNQTGLLLSEIWRYFRLTWTNQHTSTPGRTLMLLVRDRAAPCHPVIGIAALGSPIIQLKERDDWIGWQRHGFLDQVTASPTKQLADWIWARLNGQLDGLYLADLEQDGLYWPTLWDNPNKDAIEQLEQESRRCRAEHRRTANPTDLKAKVDLSDEAALVRRATTPLFRSKRCQALAQSLHARAALLPYFGVEPTVQALSKALGNKDGRDAVAAILRKAKADAVGTEMADLTVCGAVAPYNELLGGKLVAMLAASPTVVRAYHDRYCGSPGEIASCMAGRPIVRRNQLVLIATTSLYGSYSSQYNRLSMPGPVLGGTGPIEYKRVGRSRSFGTSHLSARSVDALVRLVEETNGTRGNNSIFGEGVNPKLRKVRHGLDLLGWPSDRLLQHGRQRIIYCVSLVDNLLPYLLGLDSEPNYRFHSNIGTDTAKVVDWWANRWLKRRLQSSDALARVEAHYAHVQEGQSRHGAVVTMPDATDLGNGREPYVGRG
ncbi:MAG: Druantia anti-phage system protein DruA [Actinomycetota bacterium]